MKLVFSGNDYVHKVLVVAAEAGVLDQLEFVVNNPIDEQAIIWDYNPLGRHPVLVLDDGLVLYSGLLSCEYLDSLSKGRRLFPQDGTRWKALTQMVLGDGLFDAVSRLSVQLLRPAAERPQADMRRDRKRVLHSLAIMDRAAAAFSADDFHIGHVCFAGGLSFMELRRPLQRLDLDPGDAALDWRPQHPTLAAWYVRVIQRPSLQLRPSHLGVAGTSQRRK
ncbi:MAG: glutathione S-transferase [Alphaproteobacteria bacterium]|nr:glutathione S-transferase [Alphaproteobacteria bacterium]